MAIIENTHTVPFGVDSTIRIVELVNNARTAIVEQYKAHRTAKALNALSNAQLEDIGLVRGHINAVALRSAQM